MSADLKKRMSLEHTLKSYGDASVVLFLCCNFERYFWIIFYGHNPMLSMKILKLLGKQECISVGFVPPAHWPFLVVFYTRPSATMHPLATTHTPQQPRMPPSTTHAPQQPHMPPSNHTCPLATTHAPQQPHMPPATMHAPSNHAHPPVNRITDRCKNITFANYVCGR